MLSSLEIHPPKELSWDICYRHFRSEYHPFEFLLPDTWEVEVESHCTLCWTVRTRHPYFLAKSDMGLLLRITSSSFSSLDPISESMVERFPCPFIHLLVCYLLLIEQVDIEFKIILNALPDGISTLQEYVDIFTLQVRPFVVPLPLGLMYLTI